MRIVFYIPLARPWWQSNIISHFIKKLSHISEVHVIYPCISRENEVRRYEMQLSELSSVQFHSVEGHDFSKSIEHEDNYKLAIELINNLKPRYCICRSMNDLLPTYLLSKVLYMMEAGVPPFPMPSTWITLQPRLFSHGCIPELTKDESRDLEQLISRPWSILKSKYPLSKNWRKNHKIPEHLKIIALPLEYESPNNAFSVHRVVSPNYELVRYISKILPKNFILIVTTHPLNRDCSMNEDFAKGITSNNVILLSRKARSSNGLTVDLIRHADGLVVGDSKSFSVAAFFGTPVFRMSRFASAPWLMHYNKIKKFLDAINRGESLKADQNDALSWFAYQLANDAFNPNDSNLKGADVLAYIERPFDSNRWSMAIERYARTAPSLFA